MYKMVFTFSNPQLVLAKDGDFRMELFLLIALQKEPMVAKLHIVSEI